MREYFHPPSMTSPKFFAPSLGHVQKISTPPRPKKLELSKRPEIYYFLPHADRCKKVYGRRQNFNLPPPF